MSLVDASNLDLAKYSSKGLRESRVPSCFVHLEGSPQFHSPEPKWKSLLLPQGLAQEQVFIMLGPFWEVLPITSLNPDEKV